MKKGLLDLGKAFLIGIAAAAAAFALLFLIGLAAGQGGWRSGLEAAKDGLLVVASLGLFLLAGMLLTKGKKPERFAADNGWRRHFAVLGPKSVLGVFCVAFVLAAAAADYLMLVVSP